MKREDKQVKKSSSYMLRFIWLEYSFSTPDLWIAKSFGA